MGTWQTTHSSVHINSVECLYNYILLQLLFSAGWNCLLHYILVKCWWATNCCKSVMNADIHFQSLCTFSLSLSLTHPHTHEHTPPLPPPLLVLVKLMTFFSILGVDLLNLFQWAQPEEAHVSENCSLWTFWPPRVSMGGAQNSWDMNMFISKLGHGCLLSFKFCYGGCDFFQILLHWLFLNLDFCFGVVAGAHISKTISNY